MKDSAMKTAKKIVKKSLRIALIPFILKDYFAFKSKGSSRFSLKISDFYPQIKDKTITTGFDRHYVYHTAWALRKVKEINPKKHIDIGSSLYFCTHLSAFYPTEFYDYRPAHLNLSGLHSKHGDLTALPFKDSSIESISCMHTIEHIGLGRYGDPIDPDGDIKAINELKRVTAVGGSFLFVTPVGKPKIEYNAHRIYSYDQVMKLMEGMTLKEFTLITESEKGPEADNGFIVNATKEMVDAEKYACGCFWFVKK